MDDFSDEVSIMYSNEKLKMLLEESGLPVDEVFKNYITSLSYAQLKDFPPGSSWFNTTEPLLFKKHLRGKLVLLDFFTYCCINCMHILPDLKEIEHSFSVEDGLVVVGVHSAKFENEKQADNVLNAVLRYGIEHPVINDVGAKIWQQCDIHCWPTLLLVSPEGQPLVMLMGEGHCNTLKFYIKHFLAYFSDQISHHSLPTTKSADFMQHHEPLLFPGKIRAYKDRLCISDSGNNRLIFVDKFTQSEKKVTLVGSRCGEIGFHDGAFDHTMFNQPQGVVFLNKDLVFVADTENHAIRRIDFKAGMVSTIAGNGSQSSDRNGGRIGTQQGISSPWDLEIFTTAEGKSVLLVAMAGTHQIWAVFLEDTKWWKGKEYMAGMVVCIAGSGREENRNNNYPNNAAFAQPSGLALDHAEKVVFIADSESSSVRKLSLVDGKVSGVVGGDKNPNNLFAFGDKDGVSYEGKLQHCLGLAMGATQQNTHKLFVADTYNHKIKMVDTLTNHLKTITSPGCKFNEPCGLLQLPDGKLYVADTNHHQIKICTLNSDENEIVKVQVLQLDHVDVQAMSDAIDTTSDRVYSLAQVKLFSRAEARINFHVSLSELHWTEEAPQKWTAKANNGLVAVTPDGGKDVESFSVGINWVSEIQKDWNDDVDIKFQVYTCQGDLCFNQRFIIRLPVTLEIEEGKSVIINANVIIGRDKVILSQLT